MAKITIVLEDSEDGQVKMHVDFAPVVLPGVEMTPAQYAAFAALEGIEPDPKKLRKQMKVTFSKRET